MANQNPSSAPMAGGFILCITVVAGTLIGASKGQPTIGLLAGLGLGAVIAGGIWLKGRGR